MPSRSIFSHVFFFILKWMSLIWCFSFIVSYVYQEPLKTLKSIVYIPLGYDRFSVIFSEKFFSSRNDNNVTKPFVPGQHWQHWYHNWKWRHANEVTRMHSSMMRTARSLTIRGGCLPRGVSLTRGCVCPGGVCLHWESTPMQMLI